MFSTDRGPSTNEFSADWIAEASQSTPPSVLLFAPFPLRSPSEREMEDCQRTQPHTQIRTRRAAQLHTDLHMLSLR